MPGVMLRPAKALDAGVVAEVWHTGRHGGHARHVPRG